MKRINLIAVILLAVMLLTAVTKSQSFIPSKDKNAVSSLITGINSDNNGLKRACIYFAGKYRISEAVDAMVKQLDKEKDPGNRILIALSLYEIRDTKGMEVVKLLSLADKDDNVRKMSGLIFSEFLMNSHGDFVTTKSEY